MDKLSKKIVISVLFLFISRLKKEFLLVFIDDIFVVVTTLYKL